MPANFLTGLPDIKKLKTSLQQSSIQESDKPLFQTINLLIDWISQFQVFINGIVTGGTGSGGILGLTYLTHTNEVATLPNSKQLNAGNQISFDDSVPGIRTVDASAYPPQLGHTSI
jgi:hypothetical protein